jgi:hypothetical protein
LREIRQFRSPQSFIVGRMFVDLAQQVAWLDSSNPEARGRDYANTILGYDFGYATERDAGNRLLVDAWMGLNEALRGPASFPDGKVDAEFRRRASALDLFQVAFRARLQEHGLEAVAFNFAAGNFTRAEHYLDWFPLTLASYKYLGFHEYGWPTLMENPARGTKTGALYYRECMAGIRQRYGNRHQVIITEAGLARMYRYPHDPAGDVGWLYPGETISEEEYWESLRWYNSELCKDGYVLGCCLFQVGHAGQWETFRHLGKDNQQRPITLINRMATLSCETPEEGEDGGDGGDGGEGDRPALRKRVEAAQSVLEPALDAAAGLSSRATDLEQLVTSLSQETAGAERLPEGVEALLRRLDGLESALARGGGGLGAGELLALRQRITAVKGRAAGLQPAAQQAGDLTRQAVQARSRLASLTPELTEAAALARQVRVLLAEAAQLTQLGGDPIPQPTMQDVRATLPLHPVERYPIRAPDAIKYILVHHTVTRDDISPERIAEAHVGRGKPGTTYHFLVTGDGALYWTQPLEAVVDQTLNSTLNVESVGVALAGNFTAVAPTDAQITAAADLIAWLLSTLGLGINGVYGRSELDPRVASPGAQWLDGAKFKDKLVAAIERVLRGAR